jgi:hypothetical protein
MATDGSPRRAEVPMRDEKMLEKSRAPAHHGVGHAPAGAIAARLRGKE